MFLWLGIRKMNKKTQAYNDKLNIVFAYIKANPLCTREQVSIATKIPRYTIHRIVTDLDSDDYKAIVIIPFRGVHPKGNGILFFKYKAVIEMLHEPGDDHKFELSTEAKSVDIKTHSNMNKMLQALTPITR
jgi:hypothetical protein